jgi:flagella basal body P-ring formation protein FlgA
MMFLLLFLSAMNQGTHCTAIGHDRIRGEDLARAIPALASIPPDAVIGYSPAPGARRAFNSSEIRRIGMKYGIDTVPPGDACFEWTMRTLDSDQVQAAMRDALATPDARIDILAIKPSAAPEGTLSFQVAGLSASRGIDPATPVTWRGYVSYSEGRKFAIWASVRVRATVTRIVAVSPLPVGQTILPTHVRLETYEDFPLDNGIARSLEEVVGQSPVRSIRPGAPIYRSQLTAPTQIHQGDSVRVSGQRFKARVEGKGRAILTSGLATNRSRLQ